MSTLKVTNIQHPDAVDPAIELDPVDGVVFTAAAFDAAAIISGTISENRLPPIPDSAFDSLAKFTSSNASWTIPALGSPIVKVTVMGGGGGGGFNAGLGHTNGGAGGTSSFAVSGLTTLSASGGAGGTNSPTSAAAGTAGFASGNGGEGAHTSNYNREYDAGNGRGGAINVAYIDLTGKTTANVTVGGGGSAAHGTAGAGGRGEVIVEYKAA